jgi:peptidoglycan hydrolase-like protein with peptidoglycan-binding domain
MLTLAVLGGGAAITLPAAAGVAYATDATVTPTVAIAINPSTPASGQAPLTVTFNATAGGFPPGDPIQYAFAVDDNSGTSLNSDPGNGPAATHTFTTAGTYNVKVTATDVNNVTFNAQSADVTVTVTPPPPPPNQPPTAVISSVNPSTGVVPVTVSVSGAGSSDPDGIVAWYQWIWGDATPDSSGVTASHVYGAAGTYTIILAVYDLQGVVSTASTTVTVAPPPPARGIYPAKPGQRGANVSVLQQRLTDLGFWVGRIDGVYGITTTQAVLAFQKAYGLARSGVVDGASAFWLNAPLPRPTIRSKSGNLIEVDKTRQLVIIVRNGQPLWIFNSSTGSGRTYAEYSAKLKRIVRGTATTPEGRFHIYMQRPSGWWSGDLGRIYRPKYVVGGVALHGMTNVPAYPASHGCIRVRVEAMDFIWAANLAPLGTQVWIYH